MLRESERTFDPVAFSLEENKFLSQHLGDAPEVVEMDMAGGFPVGVNPNAVMPAIERIFRLVQQAEHRGLKWAGVEAVKEGCQTYLNEMGRWAEDRKRGGPKLPSLFVWDERGRPHKGAVGSDSTRVVSYFDDQGERQPFKVDLFPTGVEGYAPRWVKRSEARTIPKLLEDSEKGTIQCPLCHFTQTFDTETRSTYNVARGRMAKHLIASRKNPEGHREVYTQEFGSADKVS